VTNKSGSNAGKPGDLARDVARLVEETGVSSGEVYAFLCGGAIGSGGGSDWVDKHVSNDVLEHLRELDL
jgi:hypothetical protein